jgi:hypothetical protein
MVNELLISMLDSTALTTEDSVKVACHTCPTGSVPKASKYGRKLAKNGRKLSYLDFDPLERVHTCVLCLKRSGTGV